VRPAISSWALRSAPTGHSIESDNVVSYKSSRMLTLLGSGASVLIAAMFFGLATGEDLTTALGLGLALTVVGWASVCFAIRAIDRIAYHEDPLADP
jgi:hypothetical protein